MNLNYNYSEVLGSSRQLVCERCGIMPIDDSNVSHEKDGAFNEDCCKCTYLGSQLECEFGGNRCFGIADNMDFLLVCTYKENGENPELVFYKKRYIKRDSLIPIYRAVTVHEYTSLCLRRGEVVYCLNQFKRKLVAKCVFEKVAITAV